MNAELKQAIANKLLAMADDEMILGHRNSEWAGHGPILEEDIAFANIALDEIGHAKVWYTLLSDLEEKERDSYPDKLVFFRDADAYRNIQMMELPNGDWGFSMMRQYLFDTFEMVRAGHLAQSGYRPIAEASAKIRSEEMYHFRHTSAWLKRLGLGTEESNRRMQTALDQLWGPALQLFEPLPDEDILIEAGMMTDPATLREEWYNRMCLAMSEAELKIPDINEPPVTDRTIHTEHLTALLAEMQEVARAVPDAEW